MSNRLDAYRNQFSMEGKVALVAGGAGGIGSAVSEGMAALGATVLLTDLKKDNAEKVAAEITEAGGHAFGFGMAVSSMTELESFVNGLNGQFGKIDVLFNAIGSHREAPAEEYKEADWDFIFDLNLKTAFFLSQAVAKNQIRQGVKGKHIHITSVRSALGLAGRGYISYCASKGGMVLMIKQLASEWGPKGITVNGIAPTFARTALVAKYLDDPDFYNPLVARIPLGRIAEPEDIAGLAMYLASPASDFVNGQNIFIDGGVTARQ